MHKWVKVAVSAAAVMFVAGTAAASASPLTQNSRQPANPHPRLAQQRRAAVDTAVESKYTPIAPCRIVDTRVGGGAIHAGSTRSFHALGSGNFTNQGGTSCGIPLSATAVTGSVIAVGATGPGYLRVFGYGAALPTASFLNYVPSLTLSASGTIPVSESTYDFTVAAATHATQVVVQLTGYYIPPMWAEVNSSGGYVQGSRVVSLTHVGTGIYQVDFDRNVTGCAYNATSYFYGTTMEVEPRSGDANAVFVAAGDYNGTGVDTYFYLTVTC
jgi:hypothetical protein